jgi:hypothetical protein
MGALKEKDQFSIIYKIYKVITPEQYIRERD